jgi:nitric oxide synthase-interacting protein
MTRKSKGKRGANAMFGLTKKEHSINGYGATTTRYGTDAQTKFGWCSLGLQPARTPVCTTNGIVFDRQAIIEYLLEQKMKLRQQQEDYTLQRDAERINAEAQELLTANKTNAQFLTQNGNDIGSRAQAQGKRTVSAVDRVRQDTHDVETDQEKTTHLKRTNFWLPEATRKAVVETKIKEPETCPRCPISGKALKSKQLITVHFTRDASISFGQIGNIVCAVSQKAIVHQKATVLKSCGHVLLSSLVKTLVLPSMRCPLCNKKVKKLKDIVELKQGGTSYSGGGEAVVSTKYKTGVR